MIVSDKQRTTLKAWINYIGPWIESEDCDMVFSELKNRKGRIKTAPLSEDLWRAFTLTQPDNLRAIIVGISPYHTFKGDTPVADGLCMSCSRTKVIQPTLENMYHAWEEEYVGGLDVDMDKDPNLEYLAAQGVLLYNIALTVQEGKACSDNKLWEGFNKMMWEVINDRFSGIPIILMGAEAHKSEALIDPLKHYIFKIAHPASASYSNTIYSTNGTFKKVDKILWDNNKYKINWYKKTPQWCQKDGKNGEWKDNTPPWKREAYDKLDNDKLPWE